MISYKIEGSYRTIDGKVVDIKPQIFNHEDPFIARTEAVYAMTNFRDVFIPTDGKTMRDLFTRTLSFEPSSFTDKDGKIIKLNLNNEVTLMIGISLSYFFPDDEEENDNIIDFIGLYDEEKIDNIGISLEDEYKYYLTNNFRTAGEKTITSYIMADYYDIGKTTPDTFTYMPTGTEISITQYPFWWMSKSELEKLTDNFANNQSIEIEKKRLNEGLSNRGSSDIFKIINKGETRHIEFKPSLYYNFKDNKFNHNIKLHTAKAICAFLNSDGGKLLIGVKNDKTIQGLENYDFKIVPKDEDVKDFFRKEFDNTLSFYFSKSILPFVRGEFVTIDDKIIFEVVVQPSGNPIFMNARNLHEKKFYVRATTSSHPIEDVENIIDYVFNRWGRK